MKRITGFLLAAVILLGVVFGGAPAVSAESTFIASDACIAILKAEEGFSAKPYWDYTQYTVGFGTYCPNDMVAHYTQNGITEAEAEVLLRNHLAAIERDINQRIIDKFQLTLTQNQFDALVLFSYNCGTGWTYESGGTFYNAIISGATGNDLVRAFALWCSAGNEIKTFLLRRRLSEANMYLNNVYSQTPPDNFCYVLYDANGGYSSPRSQGYDSNLTAAPYPVPTYAGYTFDGWYTAKVGGNKVTVLDANTKSKTLYAHWLDASGNAPVVEEKIVEITVTATEVNLRSGPGTNYTIVGQANTGDKLTITETATGTGYRWGKFNGGWICLQYTNYDTAVNNAGTTTPPETTPPETTPPETTPPETTPPETTPPETTPPETTPPETTPPVTTPPEPQKPASVMGTVNVNDWLRVRSGSGTGYSVVRYLKPKERVEILEQKTVGHMIWGRISDGWISMDYVILDKQDTSSGGNTNTNTNTNTGSAKTGTVKVNDFLRIRSGPGTGYSVAGYLGAGEKVTVTETQNSGSMVWGKIDKGWISMDYVQLDSTGSSSGNAGSGNTGSTGDTTVVTGTVKVNDFLRIRTGPGTSYAVGGYMQPNERVEITERRTVGSTVWGKTAKGWISLDYVVLDSGSSTGSSNTGSAAQKVTKTIVADCLRVRSGAGTSNAIVGYLYYGAKVEILETTTAADGTQWGKISTGWISMDYAK